MTSNCCRPRRDDGGNAGQRHTYARILEAFATLGRAPKLAEIARDLQVGEDAIMDNVRALEADGALRLDSGSSSILDAYPYSAVPTKHTARLEGGPQLYCMCAIDVFYVPFLTESDVNIESRCQYCDSAIHITVESGAIAEVDPSATVVWDSAATYDCPLTNFFCDSEHLQLWHKTFPEEAGKQIDLTMVLERGRAAAARIRSKLTEPQPAARRAVNRESTITCPHCHVQKTEIMPLDACVFFYECAGCGVRLKPRHGDCCVFCSYGSVPCPPVQE
jgi:hypothetical protein